MRGGAISVSNWPFTVARCTFRNNVAGAGGAIVNDVNFFAPSSGWSVLLPNGSTAPLAQPFFGAGYITDCVFANNTAQQAAGGQPGQCNSPSVNGCGLGGAVYGGFNGGAGQTTTLVTRCVFSGNVAANGGGAIIASGLAVFDSVFTGNSAGGVALASEAQYSGGAIQVACVTSSIVSLSNVTFVNNTALNGAGGGLNMFQFEDLLQHVLSLHDVSFVANTAATDGGGLALVGAGSSATGSFVCTGNVARSGDGGCASLSSLPPIGAAFAGGAAFGANDAPHGAGGGVCTDGSGPVAFAAASFDANSALAGGAVAVALPPSPPPQVYPVIVTGGSSFVGNAASFGAAFALPFLSNATLRLLDVSSLSNNAASVSGGVVFASAPPPGAAPPPAAPSAAAASTLPCGGTCAGFGKNSAPSGLLVSLPAYAFAPSRTAASARPGAALPPSASRSSTRPARPRCPPRRWSSPRCCSG